MPPVNSPATRRSPAPSSPPTQQPPPSYLSALREIDTPVLDLASTLTSQVEDDAADAGSVSLPRAPADPQDEWRVRNADSPRPSADVTYDVRPSTVVSQTERRPRMTRVHSNSDAGDASPEVGLRAHDWYMEEEIRVRSLWGPRVRAGEAPGEAVPMVQRSSMTEEQNEWRMGEEESPGERLRLGSEYDHRRLRGARTSGEDFRVSVFEQRRRLEEADRRVRSARSTSEWSRSEDDGSSRRRLQRVLSRLNHAHDPAYGDRVPSQQSLYDWAPATEEEDEAELQEILVELREQQSNTPPEILRVSGQSQLAVERERESRARSHFLGLIQPAQTSESSLRSTAILQSARRNPRFSSARSRDYAHQRSGMPGERIDHMNDDHERDRSMSARWNRYAAMNSTESSRYEANRLAWQAMQRSLDGPSSYMNQLHQLNPVQRDRDSRARIDAYRRGYLESPAERTPTPPSAPGISSSSSSSPPFVENAIKYLSRLRDGPVYEDAATAAHENGFILKDDKPSGYDDFLMDTSTIPPLSETSWLMPGAVFQGNQHAGGQHASAVTSTTLYRMPGNQSITSTTYTPASGPFDSTRPWLSHNFVAPTSFPPSSTTGNQDSWPVKVTIHAVDYEKMTLAGTMEAFNVPSHPPSFINILASANTASSASSSFTPPSTVHSQANPPNSTAPLTPPPKPPITTYLEGEIIDFATHTLLTEAFDSSPATDALYWRKLLPFAHLSVAGVASMLVNRTALAGLMKDWVLMRWKER
ncbi:hypothetical protein LTR04_000480, partial [Oleoguttula sp. CCFEE 6159]